MKNLILFTILFSSFQAYSQTTGKRCGDSIPQFCIEESVYYSNGQAEIVSVYVDGKYGVKWHDGYQYVVGMVEPSKLAKSTGCGKSSPKFCVKEPIYYANRQAEIVSVSADGNYGVKWHDGYQYVIGMVEPSKLAKSTGCGKTSPRFCVKESVYYANRQAEIVSVSAGGNYGVKWHDGYQYVIGMVEPSKLGKVYVKGAKPSDDSLDVYMSTDTQDIVQTYQSLATVVTKERSDFLKFISANLTQANSGDVNIMAGMVLAKIVRLSTSEAVKENFEKPMTNFLAEIAKTNWKSIEQVEANIRTVDFASRVIAASVKLKIATSANETEKSDLAQLGQITAMTQLSRKIVALQDFCKSHDELMAELIQDPRHGALGMVTADIMQWILNK